VSVAIFRLDLYIFFILGFKKCKFCVKNTGIDRLKGTLLFKNTKKGGKINFMSVAISLDLPIIFPID
jgi:hypothetical protein